MRLFFRVFSAFLMGASLLVSAALAQITAQTEDGKTVILQENGTWTYQTAEEPAEEESTEASAEACDQYTTVEVDKMEGRRTRISKETLVVSQDGGKTGLGILMFNTQKSQTILIIRTAGAGRCIDEDQEVLILFRDGSRLKLMHHGDFNCKAKATVYLSKPFVSENVVEQLAQKPIETMRVWTSDSYVQEDFSFEQSVTFMETLRCLRGM